jgi:hypothetical protein
LSKGSMRVKLLLFVCKKLLVISYLVALYSADISAAERARL